MDTGLIRSDRSLDYLHIQAPSSSSPRSSTPFEIAPGSSQSVLFTSERSSEIDLGIQEWLQETLNQTDQAPKNHGIRRHFESCWGFPKGVQNAADYADLLKKLPNLVGQISTTAILRDRLYRISLLGNSVSCTLFTQADDGVYIATKVPDQGKESSARFYVAKIREPETPTGFVTRILASFASYESAWDELILGLDILLFSQLPTPSATDLQTAVKKFLPEREDLELAGPTILRRTRELAARKSIAVKVAAKADDLLNGAAEMADSDPAKVEALTQTFLKLKSTLWTVEESIALLQSQAGYLNFSVTVTDPPANSSVHGVKISETAPVRTLWKTSYLHEDAKLLGVSYRLPGTKSHCFSEQETLELPGKPLYDTFRIDFDPWVEKERDLKDATPAVAALTGGPFSNVFRFDITDDGYVTSGGRRLEEIMELCVKDDDFRRSCAVMIPIFAESLTEGRVLTRYRILKRPLPALIATSFPRAFLDERYEYVTRLVQPEIGRLLSTINLAPGEQRKVTITKGIETESTENRTASSLLDITTDKSQELTKEAASEHRNEGSGSKRVSAEGRGGVNLGIVKFGGGAGGSMSWSSKDYESRINKSMQKAATRLTQRTKQEVSSSSSLRIKATQTDINEVTVRNINEGRTLNLLFFSVNNRQQGGLRPTAFEILLMDGLEIAEGSGAFGFIRVPLSMKGFNQIVKELWDMELPAGFSAIPAPHRDAAKNGLSDALRSQLIEMLKHNYVPENGNAPKGATRAYVLALKDKGAVSNIDDLALGNCTPGADKVPPKVDGSATDFDRIVFGDAVLAERFLYYPSSALYLDAQVGSAPAAEEFYECMRAQDIKGREAGVYRTYTEGILNEAKARWLAPQSPLKSPPPLTISDIRLERVQNTGDASLTRFTLHFSQIVPLGVWRLYYRSGLIEEINIRQPQTQHIVSTTVRQDWLDDPHKALQELALVRLNPLGAIISATAELNAYYPTLLQIVKADPDCGVPLC